MFFRKTKNAIHSSVDREDEIEIEGSIAPLTPIVPSSRKPRALTPDGKPCKGAEQEYEFRLFEIFSDFGDFINNWRSSTPFRLQELEDTRIRVQYDGWELTNRFGHRYELYYGQFSVGLVQIFGSSVAFVEGGLLFASNITEMEDIKIRLELSLTPFFPVFIPFNELKGYLGCLARMLSSDLKNCGYTTDRHKSMTERNYALHAIDEAILKAIWDGHNHRAQHGENCQIFALSFSGTPTEWYERQKAV